MILLVERSLFDLLRARNYRERRIERSIERHADDKNVENY